MLEDDEQDRGLIVVPGLRVEILRALDRVADILHPHDGAVPVGDDHVVIVGGLGELVVGGDGEAAGCAVERALGGVGGGGGEHAANVLERQPLGRELGGVDLHPHRRLLLAADRHLRHAGNLRDLLGKDGVGVVVDGSERQRVGMHAHHQDGGIGGVDLAVGRRRGKVGRQLPSCRRDCGLHVLGSRVDVAVQLELQGDRGRPECARRGHLGDAGDLSELALQWLRDGRRHGLGACSGKRRGNADGRKVDLRQRRYRQQRPCREPKQRNRDHQQRGRDRAAYEGRRDVHGL